MNESWEWWFEDRVLRRVERDACEEGKKERCIQRRCSDDEMNKNLGKALPFFALKTLREVVE